MVGRDSQCYCVLELRPSWLYQCHLSLLVMAEPDSCLAHASSWLGRVYYCVPCRVTLLTRFVSPQPVSIRPDRLDWHSRRATRSRIRNRPCRLGRVSLRESRGFLRASSCRGAVAFRHTYSPLRKPVSFCQFIVHGTGKSTQTACLGASEAYATNDTRILKWRCQQHIVTLLIIVPCEWEAADL